MRLIGYYRSSAAYRVRIALNLKGLADVCLIPQLFNARRFDCPLMAYPTLLRIDAACEALPAFRDAAPDMQPDAG